MFGSQYAMRIWLDPGEAQQLRPRHQRRGRRHPRAERAGFGRRSIGGLPATPGQAISASIIGPTRLSTPEQFRDILLRVNADGSQVRIGDVARVALNSESYTRDTKYNGKPAAGVAIRLAAGQNALDTVNAIRATIDRAAAVLPARPRGGVSARHDAVRQDLDPRSGEDAGRGRGAGVPGDVPVPAERARHADPDHRRAGGVVRHVRRARRRSASPSTR